jgi:hypothetical protein
MRRGRAAVWTAAALLAAASGAIATADSRLRPFRPILTLAVFGGVGLAGEAGLLIVDLRRPARPPSPRKPRPPDGRYEIRPIPGAEGRPNPVDPRFYAFERFSPGEVSAADEPPSPTSLSGHVLIVSLFVGRYGSSWSDEEIAAAMRALGRAAEWIEREAQRWGAAVNVDLAAPYFAADDPAEEDVVVQFVLEGDHVGPFEAQADAKTIASTSRAAAALGFADIAALMQAVRQRAEAETVVWIVHLRAAGRSLAIPAAESPVPGVALAVCYAREESFPEPLDSPPFPDPTTFVHELLHLFGATDKYKEPLSAFPRGWVSERDVMCLYQRALPRLRVDRLTAREIGWIEEARPAQN